jgi:hypothetical protein
MFLRLLFLIFIFPAAWAEPPVQNSVPDSGEVDKMLTSNSLRAMSGSLSKWSLASTWNYNGGNIASPFSANRPNIAGASATTSKSDVDGSLNVKYNYDVHHAFLAGFGLRYITPFQSTPGADYHGDRFDALNPNFIFQYLYNFSGLQAVLQAKVTQWTQSDQTANGYGQQFAIDQETMYTIGKTGLSLAASSILVYNTFTKSDAQLATSQSVYQLQFAPYAEYKINERYNLKTSLNLFMYEHYRAGANFKRDTVTQAFGVGIAFTRDIFLYPNVTFVPMNLSPKITNVGIQLTLNLF